MRWCHEAGTGVGQVRAWLDKAIGIMMVVVAVVVAVGLSVIAARALGHGSWLAPSATVSASSRLCGWLAGVFARSQPALSANFALEKKARHGF